MRTIAKNCFLSIFVALQPFAPAHAENREDIPPPANRPALFMDYIKYGVVIFAERDPNKCFIGAFIVFPDAVKYVQSTYQTRYDAGRLLSLSKENPLAFINEYTENLSLNLMKFAFNHYKNSNICDISTGYFEFQKYNDKTARISHFTVTKDVYENINWARVQPMDLPRIAPDYRLDREFLRRLDAQSQTFWKHPPK